FFFSSRRRHTRSLRDWSSDVCSSDLSVALVDKRGPGEETSYGNTGVIVGASVFPTAFPRSLKKIIQVALKRAPEANYHWRDLLRSEERRVGKECRARWSPDDEKKKEQ